MSPLYRHTDFFEEGRNSKKAEGCPPALSGIDRSLILVEGIVFVHVQP